MLPVLPVHDADERENYIISCAEQTVIIDINGETVAGYEGDDWTPITLLGGTDYIIRHLTRDAVRKMTVFENEWGDDEILFPSEGFREGLSRIYTTKAVDALVRHFARELREADINAIPKIKQLRKEARLAAAAE